MSKAALHSSFLPRSGRNRPADHLVRSIACVLLSQASSKWGNPLDTAEQWWPEDEETPRLLRAASSPANTADPQWAGSLASQAVGDFLGTLSRTSAYSALRANSLMPGLTMPRAGSLKVPGVGSIPAASFISELSAMPVLQGLTTASAALTNKKLACIIVTSRNFADSVGNVELMVRTLLSESIATGLDTVLLSDDAATASTPGGILAGAVPVTPSTSPNPDTAMREDIGAMVAALAEPTSDNLVLVANKAQAGSLRLAFPAGGIAVVSSPQMPAGTVALVDAAAFLSVNDDRPIFDMSEQVTLSMNDPGADLMTPPVTSLFQQALVGFRAILSVDWVMRSPGHVSIAESVNW